MFFLKLATIVSALASFIGVAKIAFVVQSYMMKTAFVPSSSAVIGKVPVAGHESGRYLVTASAVSPGH
eukprot:scaffold26344_cov35-Attheya_sp.AAC.1